MFVNILCKIKTFVLPTLYLGVLQDRGRSGKTLKRRLFLRKTQLLVNNNLFFYSDNLQSVYFVYRIS